jgi:hypothetical protein
MAPAAKFTPGVYLELRISLQIFGKNLSDPHRILKGMGKVAHLVTLPHKIIKRKNGKQK